MPSRKSISNPIRAFRSISAHPWQNTESKGPGVKGHTLSYRNDAISQQEAAELTCHLSIYIESPGLHWDSLWSLMGTDEGQEAALCHKAVMMMMMVVKSTPPGMQREHADKEVKLSSTSVRASSPHRGRGAEDETNTKTPNLLSWLLKLHVYKFTALTRT